jgi:hypothetical protein
LSLCHRSLMLSSLEVTVADDNENDDDTKLNQMEA